MWTPRCVDASRFPGKSSRVTSRDLGSEFVMKRPKRVVFVRGWRVIEDC
jgi:hypothetical protein